MRLVKHIHIFLILGMIIFPVLIAQKVLSQEVISGFEKRDLPVLNEELRKYRDIIKDFEDGVDLATEASGTLPLNQVAGLSTLPFAVSVGGTAATTTTNAVNNLLPSQSGNSDKFLTTNGTNTSWSAVANDYSFTSVTTWSSATNSGDITIAVDKVYKVIVKVVNESGSGCNVLLRFNSDGGMTYNNASTTSITLLSLISASGGLNEGQVEIIIVPSQGDNQLMKVYGKGINGISTASPVGSWDNSANPTSFEIVTSQTSSGTVYLYELSLS